MLAHAGVEEHVKTVLRTQFDRLDPVELLQRIRQGQAALAALSIGNPSEGPDRKVLDHFLACLPELWREGEVKTRYWRTREDPFKDVWTDILLWLQKEPDTIAKMILQKLEEKYRGSSTTNCCEPSSDESASGGGRWRDALCSAEWRSSTKCRP